MSAGRALAATLLGATLLGCADAAHERAERAGRAIVLGEASGQEQDGVVLIRAELEHGDQMLCSASVIAPRLIVTARHCVSYLSPGVFNCSLEGEPTDNPEGGGKLGLHLPAESLEVYAGAPPRSTPVARGQQVISTLSPTICKNDLAFVVLDTALDVPIVPLRLGKPARVGEAAVLVGYGMTRDDQSIDYVRQKRSQKRDLEVAAVGPDSISQGVVDVAPRSLLLEGPSGCIGDSGGPLLAQATGALLGVYSLLEGESCEAPSVRHHMVHVPAFTLLIDEAFAAAGSEPESEPAANDAAGAGGESTTTATGGASAAPGAAGEGGAEVTPAPEPVSPKSSGGCSLGAPPCPASVSGLALAVLLLALRGRRRIAARAD